MSPEFKEKVEFLRKGCGFESPVVRFSSELRGQIDGQDELDHFEGMVSLLECHPILDESESLALFELNAIPLEWEEIPDKLASRRYLAYEILIRQLGHARSLVANANALNHIGTAVAVRCMLELYAFVIYLLEYFTGSFDAQTGAWKGFNLMDKLLYGGTFSSFDWWQLEQVWTEKHGEAVPEETKEFLKTLFQTPHISVYRKHAKSKDWGFDVMYARYSDYVHPTFSQPRSQFLEDNSHSFDDDDGFDLIDDRVVNEYYRYCQRNHAPLASIQRDISAADMCLQMFWGEWMELEPWFSESLGFDLFRRSQ